MKPDFNISVKTAAEKRGIAKGAIQSLIDLHKVGAAKDCGDITVGAAMDRGDNAVGAAKDCGDITVGAAYSCGDNIVGAVDSCGDNASTPETVPETQNAIEPIRTALLPAQQMPAEKRKKPQETVMSAKDLATSGLEDRVSAEGQDERHLASERDFIRNVTSEGTESLELNDEEQVVRLTVGLQGPLAWYAACHVMGKPYCMLVDTGASTTVLDEDQFNTLDENVKQTLKPTTTRLRGATGDYLNVSGELTVDVQLGETKIVAKVIIAKLGIPGVLGMNVLKPIGGMLDLAKGEIKIGNSTVVLSERLRQGVFRLVVDEPLHLQPQTEELVTLGLVGNNRMKAPRTGMVQERRPLGGTYPIMVGRTLVHPRGNTVPLEVGHMAHGVPQGAFVATLHDVEMVVPVRKTVHAEARPKTERLDTGGCDDEVLLPHESLTQASTKWRNRSETADLVCNIQPSAETEWRRPDCEPPKEGSLDDKLPPHLAPLLEGIHPDLTKDERLPIEDLPIYIGPAENLTAIATECEESSHEAADSDDAEEVEQSFAVIRNKTGDWGRPPEMVDPQKPGS
jgi:predicted aspartyl protease